MAPNPISTAFMAEVSRRGLRHTELEDAARRCFDLSLTTYHGTCLSRPVFLDLAQQAALADDTLFLHTMLTSLPGRLFGGDMAAFARAVGMTEAQVSATLRGSTGRPTRLCRSDLYLDATGFRVLELNVGSHIGGLDTALLNRAFLTQPVFAEFAAAHRLSFPDTMAEVVQTIRAECGIPQGARPLIAATDWPASFTSLEPLLRYSAAQLAPFGLEVIPCHLGQLAARDGRVWLDGRPVDVIYRVWQIEDLLQPEGPGLVDPVLRAAERGEVAIFTPMDSDLYGSKGALALLSDEMNRHLFDPGELATLDRFLPWTRMVRRGPVTVDGELVELGEYVIAERENLILKPTLFHGGIGVVPGWSVDADDWRKLLAGAMNGPYVLQRRIRPVVQYFPGGDGPEPRVIAWGAFLGAGGYIGTFARGGTDLAGGVLNSFAGAATTCGFHQESAAS